MADPKALGFLITFLEKEPSEIAELESYPTVIYKEKRRTDK